MGPYSSSKQPKEGESLQPQIQMDINDNRDFVKTKYSNFNQSKEKRFLKIIFKKY